MSSRLFCAVATLVMSALLAPALADETLGLVTGPKTGTYYTFGKDIANIAAKANIAMEVKPSEGSVDNIKRLNSTENAAFGIVQSDVLGFLSRSKNPDSMRMAANLRMVYPFYNEEIHILARKNIKTITDLRDKVVAIGEEGSGNMLTAINLLSMMEVAPREMKHTPPPQAVVDVLKGNLDAIVFVGGKPVRLFKNLENLDAAANAQYAELLKDVHFLPLDNPKMLEEYRPAVITHADYDFVGDDVKTVAVQAIMISYDFSQGTKQRCETLASLAKAIRDYLPLLREKGHEKWQEVDLDDHAGIWQKDTCAWPTLTGTPATTAGGDLGKDLAGEAAKKR